MFCVVAPNNGVLLGLDALSPGVNAALQAAKAAAQGGPANGNTTSKCATGPSLWRS
jgi:hypothetical protein